MRTSGSTTSPWADGRISQATAANPVKKILLLCPHPVGYVPGQRLKYEQYFAAWREAGFEITVRSFMTERFQQIVYKRGHLLEKVWWTIVGYWRRYTGLLDLRNYDAVYLFLWGTPFGAPAFEFLVRCLSRRLIYDIDDLVFIKDNPHETTYLRWIKGKAKPIYLMKVADHVITGTPYLDRFARQFNPHTTDISATIDTDGYLPRNAYINDHVLTLGWSGSFSTVKYLTLLKEPLLALRKEIPFRLLVMGAEAIDMGPLEMELVPWSVAHEVPTLQRMDIGLYPLPLEEEWVLGKSGGKALQYMALGIPTVATHVGCNDRVIEHGVSGFLVHTPQEWIDTLRCLMQDPALRRRVGTAARDRVVRRFSVAANTPIYLGILRQVTRSTLRIGSIV